MSIFSAAIVLLLNIWSGRRSGISFDEKKELSDVHKCMKTLQIFEKQYVVIHDPALLASSHYGADGLLQVDYGAYLP